MVEDRKIPEIEEKLTKLFKHIPYRKYRVSKMCNQANSLTIVATSPDSFAEPIVTVIENVDDLDIKAIVKAVKDNIPEELLKIKISNISSSLNDISYNFSVDNIPESFEIVKLPYRQLLIKLSENKTFYINLCTPSYHRLLSIFDRILDWPGEVSFEQIAKSLKRKEIVTLMLSLASNV